MPTFVWSDSEGWKTTTFLLMNDCIGNHVIDYLHNNRQKNFFSDDDSEWLDKAIKSCGFDLTMTSFELLARRFLVIIKKSGCFMHADPKLR
jgi:hypothetical protein